MPQPGDPGPCFELLLTAQRQFVFEQQAEPFGVIETARNHKSRIRKLYAGRNGIIGALSEVLIDTGRESSAAIRGLKTTYYQRTS